eukprot:TRINITY_DN6501_c0_g1_i1.p1 TRINITY_DN6501_c0_g1~~TRINITY_DN6501_c0_g1_i1.p1  ORF type:complete len:1158 (+),score=269.87 TRINITY_DN6501_c0_g1_i1:285-3758(+)
MLKAVTVYPNGNQINTKVLLVPNDASIDEFLQLAAVKLRLPNPQNPNLYAVNPESGRAIQSAEDIKNDDVIVVLSKGESFKGNGVVIASPSSTVQQVPSPAAKRPGINSGQGKSPMQTAAASSPVVDRPLAPTRPPSSKETTTTTNTPSTSTPPARPFRPPSKRDDETPGATSTTSAVTSALRSSNNNPKVETPALVVSTPPSRPGGPARGSSKREDEEASATAKASAPTGDDHYKALYDSLDAKPVPQVESQNSESSTDSSPYDRIADVLLKPTTNEPQNVWKAVKSTTTVAAGWEGVEQKKGFLNKSPPASPSVPRAEKAPIPPGKATIITIDIPQENTTRKIPVNLEATSVKDVIETIAKKMKGIDEKEYDLFTPTNISMAPNNLLFTYTFDVNKAFTFKRVRARLRILDDLECEHFVFVTCDATILDVRKEIHSSAWGRYYDMQKYSLYLAGAGGKRGGILLEDSRTIVSYRLTSESKIYLLDKEKKAQLEKGGVGGGENVVVVVHAVEVDSSKTFSLPPSTTIEELFQQCLKRYPVPTIRSYGLHVCKITKGENGNVEPAFVGQTLAHSALIGDLPKPIHLVWKARETTKNAAQVFGVDPQTLEHVFDKGYKVPKILVTLKRLLLELDGLNAEGIFRLAGTEKRLEDLMFDINNGRPVDDDNVHNISTLLKRFFKELPHRVLGQLTPEMTGESEEQLVQAGNYLTEYQKHLFLWLLDLLVDAASRSSITKMDSKNLAIVWGPGMVGSSSADANPYVGLMLMQYGTSLLNQNISYLMKNGKLPIYYPQTMDPQYMPRDTESENAAPPKETTTPNPTPKPSNRPVPGQNKYFTLHKMPSAKTPMNLKPPDPSIGSQSTPSSSPISEAGNTLDASLEYEPASNDLVNAPVTTPAPQPKPSIPEKAGRPALPPSRPPPRKPEPVSSPSDTTPEPQSKPQPAVTPQPQTVSTSSTSSSTTKATPPNPARPLFRADSPLSKSSPGMKFVAHTVPGSPFAPKRGPPLSKQTSQPQALTSSKTSISHPSSPQSASPVSASPISTSPHSPSPLVPSPLKRNLSSDTSEISNHLDVIKTAVGTIPKQFSDVSPSPPSSPSLANSSGAAGPSSVTSPGAKRLVRPSPKMAQRIQNDDTKFEATTSNSAGVFGTMRPMRANRKL